jgi:hypothetical protein
MEGQFSNNGTHLFLKIKGNLYRRTIGKGWERIEKEPDDLTWNILHPNQWAAFKPALKDSGIEIDEQTVD